MVEARKFSRVSGEPFDRSILQCARLHEVAGLLSERVRLKVDVEKEAEISRNSPAS